MPTNLTGQKTPLELDGPEDVMDEAIAIASGKSQAAPTRQHLLVMALQCEIHMEAAARARREADDATALLAKLSKDLADSRQFGLLSGLFHVPRRVS